MRVLIGCEYSGVVRDAFTEAGHFAMSCDTLPSQKPGLHYMGDVRDLFQPGCHWDLAILFPPCTNLCSSGARYFEAKRKDGRQQQAIAFFLACVNAPADRIAIENPVGVMSSIYRKPDQIIQPYQFGHPESKATCMWLKNLPILTPTCVLPLPEKGYWENQTPKRQNKLTSARFQERSRTYAGIAAAMAQQWGKEEH